MLLFVVSSLLLAPAAATQPQSPDQRIIVIGNRSSDLKAALAACLARKCAPNEDIDASLALAERQLLSGDYRDARTTLLGALRRNKDEARRYPEPLSDLYRANGLVAAHLGMDADYYNSTWEIYRTLTAGIPKEDYRHLRAKMEIAAMTSRLKGLDRGERAYREAAEEARRLGRADIAGMAEVRAAWLVYKQQPAAGRSELYRLIQRSPPMEPVALSYAKLFAAAVARSEGHIAEADRLVRDIVPDVRKPILLYSPPYELAEQELGKLSKVPAGGADLVDGNVLRRPSRNVERMWVDVSFFVQPDGTVSDVEVIRSKKDTFWAKPLIASIQRRKYTPFAGSRPYPKVERYTYTAGYEQLTGTRVPVRSPKTWIEFLDLSS